MGPDGATGQANHLPVHNITINPRGSMTELTEKDLTEAELLFTASELNQSKPGKLHLEAFKLIFNYEYRNGSLEYTIQGAPIDLRKKIGREVRRDGNKSLCGPFRLVAKVEAKPVADTPAEEKPAPKKAPARRGRPKKTVAKK